MKLSVLMPVFNEEATVVEAVRRVLAVDYPCEVELVVVDDGSVDGTTQQLELIDDQRLTLVRHPANRGKGAALHTAAEHASGDYLVVCDADLEYAPEDIPALLAPVEAKEAEVVYGTRSFGSNTAFSFWYVIGNKAVTMWANLLFNTWITDVETCFKLLPAPLFRTLELGERGFGIEAEITGKLLKRGHRPFEVPISYTARTREEGKKLTWRDGVAAVWILARVRLSR
jgi:glycosyltransferase involved in cell wall biosynthesis